MRAAIFTEESRTTSDVSESKTAREYFKGTFQPVTTLSDELSKYANTELHILSEQLGYLLGDSPIEGDGNGSADEVGADEKFSNAIVTAAGEADVLVILLTASTFRDTVTDQWDAIVSNTRPDSIWFLGASKRALQSIDLDNLESRANTVLVYERVGVAPLGQEVRDELVECVRERFAQEE